MVEKPFGHNLESAKALNAQILARLAESQVFRIDHFLGKETVQNIMALRFSNGIFEPLWNRFLHRARADHGGRDGGGRGAGEVSTSRPGRCGDMVPNHLFQLLSTVAMEPPTTFEAEAVRTEKAKVIQAIKPMDRIAVGAGRGARAVCGGAVGGAGRRGISGRARGNAGQHDRDVCRDAVEDRQFSVGRSAVSICGTGKRMATRRTEIAIHFRQAPYAMFRDTPVNKLTPNIMMLHIQPSEGITLNLSAKVPGPKLQLGGVAMDFPVCGLFQHAEQHGIRDAAVRRDDGRCDAVPAGGHGRGRVGGGAADPGSVGAASGGFGGPGVLGGVAGAVGGGSAAQSRRAEMGAAQEP